ncbi:MAG: Fic family protein [Thermoleophilia bacterium]|nr:Fic family protein [Thermoleophilia bacterium]
MKRKTGHYVVTTTAGETVKAFVPDSLPPKPSLKLDAKISDALDSATLELGRLDVAANIVPNTDWFIYGFVRKEAVVTSQIEGYEPTLSDLLSWEAKSDRQEPGLDLKEVCNYLDALEYARAELANPRGLPISLRLLKQTHKRLMQGVRGAAKQPGHFRTSQNWIGGARPGNAAFVPPPPDKLTDCLDSLEKYIHKGNDLPKLVRIGLVHVQFETIHPFLDGNGRLGRLLIALLLEQWRLLSSPLLYISVYFKRNREEYYDRLASIRKDGDWEGWTLFFLEGVASMGREATVTAEELFKLLERDRLTLLGATNSSVSGLRLLDQLASHPYMTLSRAVQVLGTSKPTATKAMSLLAENGILREMDTEKRPRTFVYQEYIDLLKEDTERI